MIEQTYNNQQAADQIKEQALSWQELKNEIRQVIVGQDHIIDRIFIGLLCNGHILLEGVPGLAKTTLIKSVAQGIGLNFSRIQFTPDLLPADLIGTLIYNPKTQDFQVKKGPVFSNLVLADEINRAPAKVQSALLEAMQEHQVTIGETSYALEKPFLVLATQNPIDQEGTYRLPEAQVDRFMFKLLMTYPKFSEEKEIITKHFKQQAVRPVITSDVIIDGQEAVRKVYVDEKVVDYILSLVFATRNPEQFSIKDIAHFILHGASPRATIALTEAAKAHAFLRKRHFVIPDDVKAIALDVLRHRILLTFEAEAENISSDSIITTILRSISAP